MEEVVPIIETDNVPWKHLKMILNLINHYKVHTMCEVGIYKGETLRGIFRSSFGSQVTNYFGVDVWEVNNVHWKNANEEQWDGMYFGACKYLPYFPQAKLLRMPSVKAATLFLDGYFDMVYIDADHSPQNVLNDIKAWLPKVKKGGILAGHDYVTDKAQITETFNVKKAVDEAFGTNFTLHKCCVWVKEVM